jgi:nucleotide-binding universal stress UspA family protein
MRKNERIDFQRILFPTDLTPQATDGLEYAVALARCHGAKLFLCHCVGSQAEAGASEDAKRLLSELMGRHLHADSTANIEWQDIVVEGETATEVTRLAAEQRIDLIVMYSRRIPPTVTLLKSTAEAISRTAPCPVLITHKQGRERALLSTNEMAFKRILVAYDFSGDAELALTHGVSIAQEFQSELHLMHVLSSIRKTGSSELAMVSENREKAFRMAATRLSNAVPAEAHLWSDVKQVVCEGLPYREVLAYAAENNIDLICVGASGAGFGMWALFGSNADRILRQAACPVLIARPLRPFADEAGANVSCQVAG